MLNFFTITLFLLTIKFYVFPQADFYRFDQQGLAAKINNLKKNLPALKDFKKIDCLNDLSESYLTFNRGIAKEYTEQALQQANKIIYIKCQGEAYRNLGRTPD